MVGCRQGGNWWYEKQSRWEPMHVVCSYKPFGKIVAHGNLGIRLAPTKPIPLEKIVGKDKGNCVYWDNNKIKKFIWEKKLVK